MSSGESGDRPYARAVERALTRLGGRPVVLSPRDFALLSGWRRRGVPLGTVLEALEAAARRSASRGTAPSLIYAARAVEEAWDVVRTGRAPTLPVREGRPLSLEGARGRWSAAMGRAPDRSPLGGLLARLLDRLDRGEDPARVDLDLDEELPGAVPGPLLARVQRDVRTRLVPFHGRMGEGAWSGTVRRAVADGLRAALDLPRLALCEKGHGPRGERSGSKA